MFLRSRAGKQEVMTSKTGCSLWCTQLALWAFFCQVNFVFCAPPSNGVSAQHLSASGRFLVLSEAKNMPDERKSIVLEVAEELPKVAMEGGLHTPENNREAKDEETEVKQGADSISVTLYHHSAGEATKLAPVEEAQREEEQEVPGSGTLEIEESNEDLGHHGTVIEEESNAGASHQFQNPVRDLDTVGMSENEPLEASVGGGEEELDTLIKVDEDYEILLVHKGSDKAVGDVDATEEDQDKDDVDHSAVELDSSKSPLQDRFYRPTVTTTLFITSSITTYSSCYTTLVANMATCSSRQVVAVTNTGKKRKRSSEERSFINESAPNFFVDSDEEREAVKRLIRASKVQEEQISDSGVKYTEPSTWIEGSRNPRFFITISTSTVTVTSINSVVVQQAATQTIRLTTPGCFPSALFSSQGVTAC